jgi:hypothetical protein
MSRDAGDTGDKNRKKEKKKSAGISADERG